MHVWKNTKDIQQHLHHEYPNNVNEKRLQMEVNSIEHIYKKTG